MMKTLPLGYIGVDNAGAGGPLESWDVLLKEFGAYVPYLGYLPETNLMIEVDEEDEVEPGIVRTPMLEVNDEDYAYIVSHGAPYDGCMALGDTGRVYEYDGMGAFFSLFGQAPRGRKTVRRLRRKKRPTSKAKKAAKAQAVKKTLPKIIKTLPDQTAMVKVADTKIQAAIKAITPIMKGMTQWAKTLAPVAALVPGYGPVIAQLAQIDKKKKRKKAKKKGKIKAAKLFKKMKPKKSGKLKMKSKRPKKGKRPVGPGPKGGGPSMEDIAAMMRGQGGMKSGVTRRL